MPPMNDRTAWYIQQIQKRYPDLRVETASLNQAGQYNDVLIVNEALVFRFPRIPQAVESLWREKVLLGSLVTRLSLAIPHPKYYYLETDAVGEAFLGYQMLSGESLWREIFVQIREAGVLDRIAAQLTGFLDELHHVPVDETIPIHLPTRDTRREWAELFEQIRDKLFTYMRPDARRGVEAHFADYLDNPERYEFKPALRHGDFGAGNILYDVQQSSIVGILDFAGTTLGDPAVDYAGLLASYGDSFFSRCRAAYPRIESALARVYFYRGTFALQEALFGVENDDPKALERGLAGYV